MLRFSTNNREFNEFKSIGFDLDGTLYDEFAFISQAYVPVADYIASISNDKTTDDVLSYMQDMWLNEGSSKQDLFQQAFSYASVKPDTTRIKDCINLFRTAPFDIRLTERIIHILDLCKSESKFMFLITDGNPVLQRKKIKVLNLEYWFEPSLIFITGDLGKEYYKPNIKIIEEVIKKLPATQKQNTCYFGDRCVDEQFALSAGFKFYYAPCMYLTPIEQIGGR